MTDIVLIHGTTQSSAGFDDLVAALAARGHRALAPDIPSDPAATAAEYADLIAADLPTDVERPVVAAHSAAGLLLPALAARLDAAHQIWLAAAVADHAGGRSLAEEIAADPLAVLTPEWAGLDPTTDPVLATYFLFHDADLATLRTALGTVRACDLSGVYREPPTADPAARPSTYVLPTGDRALQTRWMDHVARNRLHTEPTLLDGGHNLYVAHPGPVADVIARAVDGPAQKPTPCPGRLFGTL